GGARKKSEVPRGGAGRPGGRSLLELEEEGVRAPVVEPEVELHACPGPVRVGLPDIAVLVGRRVVLQGAAPRRDRRLDDVRWLVGVAGYGGRPRIACSEDVQPLVPA